MRHDVEFAAAHGTILRGWWYVPDGRGPSERAPGVVMTHGFSATRHMGLEGFAEVFCDAGMAVLAYDKRNLGDSDGEPRQRISPWADVRDYRYALDWIAARPEVDPDRLAVWGTSNSGGLALAVGAIDARVKAVVANVPHASIPGSPYDDAAFVAARVEAMSAAIASEDGLGSIHDDETSVYPMSVIPDGDEDPCAMPQPEAVEWFSRWGARPEAKWVNAVTRQGLIDTDPPFDPGACAVGLHKPLLMLVADGERLTDLEGTLEVFGLCSEPKRLVMLEGDHFCPYQGPMFDVSSAAMRDFLVEQL